MLVPLNGSINNPIMVNCATESLRSKLTLQGRYMRQLLSGDYIGKVYFKLCMHLGRYGRQLLSGGLTINGEKSNKHQCLQRNFRYVISWNQ